jgi:integrase
MAKPRRKCWSFSAGRRPYTVGICEFEPGSNLFIRVWDRSRGDYRYKSLGHKNRKRAIAVAHRAAERLRRGKTDILLERVTLRRLFRLYRRHKTPRKSEARQQNDLRCMEMFKRMLGPDHDPHNISDAQLETFFDVRKAGEIDSRGNPVATDDRRPVSIRTAEADLRWLSAVCRWGTRWKVGDDYLLQVSPFRGFSFPRTHNPRRPVLGGARLDQLLAVSDLVEMEVMWGKKRERRRSYLTELIILHAGTGRRNGSIRHLQYRDLVRDVGPHGAIRWRASADKMGRESVVPISAEVREVIDRILAERPGIGKAYLFPAPRDPSKPVRYELTVNWLRKAEELGGLEPQPGGAWHPFRRRWASERRDLPLVDVAKAGGWSSTRTLVDVYMTPDMEGLYKVVSEPQALRQA